MARFVRKITNAETPKIKSIRRFDDEGGSVILVLLSFPVASRWLRWFLSAGIKCATVNKQPPNNCCAVESMRCVKKKKKAREIRRLNKWKAQRHGVVRRERR